MLGWQEYGVCKGNEVRKVGSRAKPSPIPLSTYLGCVGMPGVTAWYGVNQIIGPIIGETVVVSAASGAVGSVVGQLVKKTGARVVGIAGGPEKCRYVEQNLGFDVCIDYKHSDFLNALKTATPKGIDGVFENVGGGVFDACLARMNAFGRVAVCGLISGYNGEATPMNNIRSILINRLKVQGFIVSEHMALWPQALSELGADVASGKLKYRETVAQGLASAPSAFLGLLKGANFGKQIVKLI
jgi:NADPH-dependent curcumin reductase